MLSNTLSFSVQCSSPQPKLAMLCFHGLGAPADDLAFLGDLRAQVTPDLLTVSVAAPAQSVSLYQGYVLPSWFDIESITEVTKNMEHSLDTIILKLCGLVNDLQHIYPTLEQISLLGFSQGGVVALALSDCIPVHDLTLLSTFYFPKRPIRSQAKHIFLSHGTLDSVVPVRLGKELATRLGEATNTTFGPWEHTIPATVLTKLQKFWGN